MVRQRRNHRLPQMHCRGVCCMRGVRARREPGPRQGLALMFGARARYALGDVGWLAGPALDAAAAALLSVLLSALVCSCLLLSALSTALSAATQDIPRLAPLGWIHHAARVHLALRLKPALCINRRTAAVARCRY